MLPKVYISNIRFIQYEIENYQKSLNTREIVNTRAKRF